MNILGIHKDPWHNTGASIITEVGATPRFFHIDEERLNRKKDSREFPHLAIKQCLEFADIDSISDVDLVVMDYICNATDWRSDFHKTPCSTDNILQDVAEEKIHIINHHLAHAYSSFYTSPYTEAAILIIDGRGSTLETQSLFQAKSGSIELLETTNKIGIGLLYAAITQAIGFDLLQEGKTMGLAPYGEHIQQTVCSFPKKYDGIITDYSDLCVEQSYELKVQLKGLEDFDTQTRLAFEVQKETEEALYHLAKHAKKVTGLNHLCLSGGVALNSVANYKLLQTNIFEDLYINPAASDRGISLGCALYGYHNILKRPKSISSLSPFLGRQYTKMEIEQAIAAHPEKLVTRENAVEKAIALLADNKIVAHCSGRAEMGPRALGNRSILMSPCHAENKDTLNFRVKHREGFRPFAPAVLEEYYQDYFEIDRPNPYMLMVPLIKKEKRELIPAVTHVDGTGRFQTIGKDFNPSFHKLLEGFHERTGVPVLLNTSFNVAGAPIVDSPRDAMDCFLGTDIDALLMEDILIEKV